MKLTAAAVLGAAFAVGAVAIAAAISCIPDIIPGSSPEAAAQVGPICGDGIIDLDAGETCDPGMGLGEVGDGGLAGCGSDCKIRCAGFLWPYNHHCYELLPQSPVPVMSLTSGTSPGGGFMVPNSADGLCAKNGKRHVVTFASEQEFQAVTSNLDGGMFWVGLIQAGVATGASYYVPVRAPFEPGLQAGPSGCGGCYAYPDPDAALPLYSDAAAESGPLGCIVASSDPQVPWRQYPCSVPQADLFFRGPRVICELEPAGSLLTACEAGTWCIDLVATYPNKHYVYQPTPVLAPEAAKGCLDIGGRLVVLQSPEEREQLWHELSSLGGGALTPQAFWIGLESPQQSQPFLQLPPSSWKWDDDASAQAYPSEWGTAQPTPILGQPQAFLLQTQSADNTLAHNDFNFNLDLPNNAGMAGGFGGIDPQSDSGTPPGSSMLPFVCEIWDTLATADAGAD